MIKFQTVSGKMIDLENPEPDDFNIDDIAIGLSNTCRWGGQISYTYTVAQHSVLVAAITKKEDRMAALLHDASEAYLCDIPTPLKESKYMEGYRYLEARVQAAIYLKFGVTKYNSYEVKYNDRMTMLWEQRDLFEDRLEKSDIERLSHLPIIFPTNNKMSYKVFIDSFEEIYGKTS